MQTVPAKSILSPYRETGWFGSNYTANLYRGCSHACIYCDSRSSCYRVEEFETVRAKENAVGILERELAAKRRRGGLILTGAMGDPYNPYEPEAELTRTFLRLTDRYGFSVMLITKSAAVCRDADLLSPAVRRTFAAVGITITAADDTLGRKIEPQVSLSSERFEALEKLAGQNVCCGVLLMPVLPFITDTKENIVGIVERAADAGAAFVYAGEQFAVSLRDRQREYYYQQLDQTFPGIRERYEKTFGDQYWCCSPDASLQDAFVRACRRSGIQFRHDDIANRVSGRPADIQTKLPD